MKRIFALLKETWSEFSDDHAQRLGAALAYYTIFSIAPLLLISVAIAGLFFGKSSAQQQIVGQIHAVLGSAAGDAITDLLKNAAKSKSGALATIIGIVTLLLGAAGVFGQLKDALNVIWNVEPKKSSGIWSLLRQRFLSMAMVLGVGFLLLVTLVIDAAISAMGHWLGGRLPGGEAILQAAQLILSLGVVTVLFAMIFRFLPDTDIQWRDVWLGSAFTSLLFVVGKFGLGLYLGRGTVGSAYGAAGSLVIILVWVYWSAQILFFGAEFTQVYARRQGSRAAAPERDAKPVQQPAEPPRAPLSPIVVRSGGGGAGKLAAGGAAGLILGALIGAISAVVVLVKSAKKLMPF